MRVTDLPSLLSSPYILYKCIYGSQAFGLATATSDVDIRGVFVLPKKQFYGLDRIEQISDERSNEFYWELDRFVALLLKNNPNALECLAIGEEFIQVRDIALAELKIEHFLSGLCYETFARYAATQLKKARGLNKKIVQPVPGERKKVIDFCYVLEGYGTLLFVDWIQKHNIDQTRCGLVRIPHIHDSYALFIGSEGEFGGIVRGIESDDVHTSSIPKGREPAAILTFNKDAYRRACKAHQEYWSWVKNRNEDRYKTNIDAGKGYDTKNMMHVFRLIGIAEDIVRKKQIITFRPEREDLLKIKRGERTYDDLLKEADERLAALEDEFRHCDLPPEPDRARAVEVLYRIRESFYSRIDGKNEHTRRS